LKKYKKTIEILEIIWYNIKEPVFLAEKSAENNGNV
jgi:hypothetical protein